jgi:hypothetical protein
LEIAMKKIVEVTPRGVTITLKANVSVWSADGENVSFALTRLQAVTLVDALMAVMGDASGKTRADRIRRMR